MVQRKKQIVIEEKEIQRTDKELIATVKNLANFGATGYSTTRPENWGYVAE